MPWVDDASAPLVTDLYELTMAAGYLAAGIHDTPATFELSVRKPPEERRFLVAAGLEDVLRYVDTFRFDDDAIAYLRSTGRFDDRFLSFLADLRFDGEVRALPEGTIAFAQEPLLAVTAPLVQAQILETFVLATIGFQSMIASKAARVRLAAGERTIADFGARRAHGPDAGLKAARAAYVGGIDATSLVLAGRHYGLPTTGTMAHSYVLAHSSELESFLTFARTFPDDAVLLIDTFDTLEGARIAAEAAARLAEESIEIDAVRLDSGDLGSLAVGVRQILDDAGFPGIRILASGGLDEYEIAALLEDGAPIDGFGVGTSLTTSGDAPSLDVVYKLVEDDGEPVMKTSTGKLTLPGRKQVFRTGDEGAFSGDTIALADEEGIEGTPLLARVVRAGSRTTDPEPLSDLRQRTLDGLDRLPDPLRTIEPGEPGPYPVRRSDRLDDLVVSLGGPSQDG